MAEVRRYVVIGSSAAGTNGVRELRKRDENAEITLISRDKDIYSRCILHGQTACLAMLISLLIT